MRHTITRDAARKTKNGTIKLHISNGGCRRSKKRTTVFYRRAYQWFAEELLRRCVENVAAGKRKTICPNDVHMELALMTPSRGVCGLVCAGLRRKRVGARRAPEAEAEPDEVEEEEIAPAKPAGKRFLSTLLG